ncbi:chemotaxis response regulator protein-glutamate methylesterase [Geomonas limicola]|uniref:Protein-glutamate methylesterase/protein-glutamine glutaminase n=1 Tax=Geomonas limicola TaxID=2740186 RepID=A0A6V8NB01_9BACT|nr:chemotaxis protein CheB [Geomonas limicola]GFO69802.1 chemotaxis response regulator protein-glutamate methylesterase [Geomonas limicola]
MIRVLVVEDSKTVQKALVAALEADPELRVVAVADSGEEAVQAAATLRPDLITMDINLPGMDGFQATRAIMSNSPTPIVVVTGKLDPRDSDTLFRVMQAGALMVLAKPAPLGSPNHAESVARLIHHLKLMSEIKVVRRSFPEAANLAALPEARLAVPGRVDQVRVVGIGASTGGPPLLQRILSSLPQDYNAAVLLVQHMAEGFTENFVAWLQHTSRLPISLARDGMPVEAGQVLVAPDGYHLEMAPGNRVILSSAPPENGLRPSVAALFRSLARHCGRQSAGVLLTGMGSDGAKELKLLRQAGGITIAQNRESSVVFGMPGEAIRLDAASYILPPEGIIELLTRLAAAAPDLSSRS